MSASGSSKLKKTITILQDRYGDICWWPGDRDEAMIGAILIRPARWENVIRALALAALRAGDLSPIAAPGPADVRDSEEAIRCTGCFAFTVRRLMSLAVSVRETCGSAGAGEQVPPAALRNTPLSGNGIGKKMADSILWNVFSRTSLVINTYTEIILRSTGIPVPRHGTRSLSESVLPCNNRVYRQVRGQSAEYAKEFCGEKRCNACILVNLNG